MIFFEAPKLILSNLVVDHLELMSDAAVADLVHVSCLQLLPEVGVAFQHLDDFLQVPGGSQVLVIIHLS